VEYIAIHDDYIVYTQHTVTFRDGIMWHSSGAT